MVQFSILPILFLFMGSSFACAAQATQPALNFQQKIAHLYHRLTYGPRPSDLKLWKDANSSNIDQKIKTWIEKQLNPDQVEDRALEEDLKIFPVLTLSATEAHEHYKTLQEYLNEGKIDNLKMTKDQFASSDEESKKKLREKIGEEHLAEDIVRQMVSQRILRALRSHRQLQEVLFDFWYNHFNVDITKGQDRWLVPSYERDVIRKHLFGKFEDLLKATAHHPAMLFYLDNFLSRGPTPKQENGLNENYAREILELHTLGVEGGYSQKDVTELARILTGWSIEEPQKDPQFKFKERIHDRGEKLFLGKVFPAGHGEDEGDRALEMIARDPHTAKFIASKLVHAFVSDHPQASLIDKLSRRFMKSGGDLKAVYRELFLSPEFWSKSTYLAKIKKPSQFVFSAVRTLNGDADTKNALPRVLAEMGEDLYKCAPPTGYKDDAQSWVNPGAMVSRLNFALKVSANKIDGVYTQIPSLEQNHQKPETFIQSVAKKLMSEKLSQASEKIVLKEFDPEHHQMLDGEVRAFGMVKAVGLILGSPEFQRR